VRKLSLNSKIAFVLSLFVVGSIAISYIGLSKMKGINDSLKNIVNISSKRVNDAHVLKELLFIQLLNEKNYILEKDPEYIKTIEGRIVQRDQEIRSVIERAMAISTERGKEELTVFANYYQQWSDNMNQIKALSREGNPTLAFDLSAGKGREIRYKSEEVLDRVMKRNSDYMIADSQASDETYKNSQMLVLATSIGVIFFGLILAFFILRALSKAIGQVIDNLNSNSMQVTTAANQIASSSEELSQAATEQAASLEETSSSIEEMNSMVQRNAENAGQTSNLAQSSQRSASRGQDVVKDMIKAIGEINESNTQIMKQVDESNKEISDIINVINEIGNKTKVINDIVFQTKLLSFNASVEAARAGEHGKGFAVVAEEVGSLAQMSGNAAREISDMLEASTQRVQSIVEGTKQKVGSIIIESKTKIDHGTNIAKDCGNVLDEIVRNISDVNQMAGDISTACQEQAQGVQEITRAMSLLDQVTQTNAATSEEAASSAEELSSQAESLRSCVNVLIQTIKGESSRPTSPMRIEEKTIETTPKNVVHLKPSNKKVFDSYPMKKVAGHDVMPTEDDPRFKDV
jgi:methyl-accepting chemotaxis protein